MSKSKTRNIRDCTLIAVFFLCIMKTHTKTHSSQENTSVNMSAIMYRADKTELNSTEKMDYYSSLVTNGYESTNFNRTQVHVDIEHNDRIESNQIESNNFDVNLFSRKNAHNSYNTTSNHSFTSQITYQINQLSYDFNQFQNSSEQNTSQNSNVLFDEQLSEKDKLILPIIPLDINIGYVNDSSRNSEILYTSGSKTYLEDSKTSIKATKTYTESDIKQTPNDLTVKITSNEIESQMTEQTNLKDLNMKVIIAETTEVDTTITKTTLEYSAEMANNFNKFRIETMFTTSGKCNARIEIKPNITQNYVFVHWKLKPEITHNFFRLCLYLSESDVHCSDLTSNGSGKCSGPEENFDKCSNVSNNECRLKKRENLNYIIGWYGCGDNNKNYTNCTSYFMSSDNTGSDTKVIVITLAIVVPLVICVALFSAYFYNKQKKTNCLGVKKLKQIPLSRSSSRKPLDKMPTDGSIALNMEQLESKVNLKSKPILLTKFDEYYLSRRADTSLKLAEEYEELKSLCVKKKSAKLSQITINKPKNRFVNILPYDHSIVPLKLRNGELGSDYINANFIAGHNSNKEYIACQGPLKSTVNDFFRMVIEHNVRIIVMLTQCIEKGRQKCEKYWPSSDDVEDSSDSTKDTKIPTLEFDDIAIELCDERTQNDFVIRDLRLLKDNSIHLLTQYHFSQWPDFGCPQNPLSLIHLIEVIRKHFKTISLENTNPEEHEEQQSFNSPILVHCSAGVGRSGTFIAVDRIWQKLSKIGLNSHRSESQDISIDIFGTVYDMRKNRPNMVQTEDQYIYIYECVKHLIDKIQSENSNNHSEESRIQNEDVIEIMDQIHHEEDKEDKEVALNNNYILEDESNTGAFVNHQFSLEEVSEKTEL